MPTRPAPAPRERPTLRLLRRAGPALAALLASCAADHQYLVRFNLEGQRQLDLATAKPSPDAAEVLRGATTIAFNPPDACRDVKAAGAGASEVSNVMRLSCGVLMTELEGAAAREGFQVVSWQTLRGSAPAISYAKENKVDVLFEINDLSFDVPVQDLYTFTDVAFLDRDVRSGATVPLVVPDPLTTGKRCQEQFLKSFDPTLTVTLDAKMVTVADGRVRWGFRDTRRERADEHVSEVRTWPASASGGNALTQVGGPLMAGGAGFWLAGALGEYLSGETDTILEVYKTGGFGAIVVGGVLLLAGLALPPEYPAPDAVLCHGPAIEDLATTPQAVTPGPAASVSFSQQGKVKGREEEIRRTKLLNVVTSGFIETIARMKRSGPAAPPAPPLVLPPAPAAP